TAVPLERAAGHGVAVGRYDILDRRTRRGRPRRSRVPRWSLRFPAASLLAAARWYRAVGPTHTTRDRWLSRSHVGAVCDVGAQFPVAPGALREPREFWRSSHDARRGVGVRLHRNRRGWRSEEPRVGKGGRDRWA